MFGRSNFFNSEIIKKYLDDYYKKVVDQLDNGQKIKRDKFCDLIDEYFNSLGFYGDGVNDENIVLEKEAIENIFSYVSQLKLNNKNNYEFVSNFLKRLSNYNGNESSAFYDLLMSNSIKDSKAMRDFLTYKDNSNEKIMTFVNNLYKVVDDLDKVDQDKIDYIFHSSFDAFNYFFDNPEEILVFLNKNIIKNFNKESLSLLLRVIEYDNYKEFFKAPEEFLKVIGAMNERIFKVTGRNSDFLDAILTVFDNEKVGARKEFVSLFIEYYDKYYVEGIENDFDDVVFEELLLFALDEGCVDFIFNNNIFSLEGLLEARHDEMKSMYVKAFGRDHFLDLQYGTLDPDNDLICYNSYLKLSSLMDLFFRRVYGVSHDEAFHIKSRYGEFLDICCDDFSEEDKKTLEVLKAICAICDLDVDDKEKIKALQVSLYNYIQENGMFGKLKNGSGIILKALINRMYMRTFNNVLYSPDNTLYVDEGVRVVDAPIDFNMIVSAIDGTSLFFHGCTDFKKQYNTTSNSDSQGLCTSFINNENLGVISLDEPLFAYNNFDINTLNLMGVGDIYSDVNVISISNDNKELDGGNYFLTPKKLADYTRFGYNEMVFDRFLFKDDDEVIKIQPSYIVAYKIDDNYRNTGFYQKALKMARDFDIPLVLIDVLKIKENEKNIILKMEEELFSNKKVNVELMKNIVTRYMNNYSGSLTICRSSGEEFEYKEDFSVKGLANLLEKVKLKINDLADEEALEWIDALEECYKLERDKNGYASEVASYEHSLKNKEFLLDDEIDFIKKINLMRESRINRYYLDNNMVDTEVFSYIPKNKQKPEQEVFINLANCLFDRSYVKIEDNDGSRVYLTKKAKELSSEEQLDYGMIISYLFGDYSNNYFGSLDCDDLVYVHNSKPLKMGLLCGYYVNDVRKSPLLMELAEKVFDMDDKPFLDMFEPMISNSSDDRIKNRLLARKNDIFFQFAKLPDEKIEVNSKVLRKV